MALSGQAAVVGTIAVILSLFTVPWAGRLARRLDMVDRPGPLKVQTAPVPYLGGLGLVGGVALGTGLDRPWLGFPLAGLVAVGLVDDRRGVSPWLRLSVEVAAGVLLVAALPMGRPAVAGALGVLAMPCLVNGVNMIDGLDGLAGGVGLISAVGFVLIVPGRGALLAVGLAGGLAGFLPYNRPPARIYLGDAGSYLVGGVLASLLVMTWGRQVALDRGIAAVGLVAYPLLEVLMAVLRRVRGGRSLSSGDRDHVYDRLVKLGLSGRRATAACVGVQAVAVAVSVMASRVAWPAALGLVGAVVVSILVLGARVGSFATSGPG